MKIQLFGATCAAFEIAQMALSSITGEMVQLADCDLVITNLQRPVGSKHFEMSGHFFLTDQVVPTRFTMGITVNKNEHGRWVPIHEAHYMDVGEQMYFVKPVRNPQSVTWSYGIVTREGDAPVHERRICIV